MANEMSTKTKRPRISVDIEPALRRQLRLAAAQQDVTVKQYVTEAIVERLHRDAGESVELPTVLTSANDPVLGDLWNNEFDAEYDRI